MLFKDTWLIILLFFWRWDNLVVDNFRCSMEDTVETHAAMYGCTWWCYKEKKKSTRMFYDWSLFKQGFLSQRIASRSSVVEPISLRCTQVNKESTSHATRVVPLCHLFEVYCVLTYYQADTQWLLSFFTTQPSLFHVLISLFFFLVLSLFHYAFILLMSVCHSEASPIISLT